MSPTLDTLNDLYADNKTCAQLVGLSYVADEDRGLTRQRHGKGFTYKDDKNQPLNDTKIKRRIAELVIPPAWQNVWICPSDTGHVLATGMDDKGRKQYIYHPKWRTMRDLIKFYRLIVFANTLPKIRRKITADLRSTELTREKVLAMMLWILDNCYIRIGNDVYFQENDSVGLTTLTDKNIVVAKSVVTLSFKGKSHKDQQITFDNKHIAEALDKLRKVRGARLFRYRDSGKWRDIDAEDINAYLHDLTNAQVSAKDFRTWGGTLMAYMHLVEEHESKETKKPEKVMLEAVDQAAAVLGNTRSIARSSYVHPDILNAYTGKDFGTYYRHAQKQRKIIGLDESESQLLDTLGQLFEKEFDLLKK